MRDWKSLIGEALKFSAHQVERVVDRASRRIRRRMGWTRPPQIIPYRGYGSSTEVFLEGRVIEEQPLGAPRADDAWWENALAMYRRFRTRDVSGMPVQATFLGHAQQTVTDDEGYYRFHIPLDEPPDGGALWHDVELTLPENVSAKRAATTATGSVMIARPDSQFGVISDIDDTIMKSHATDILTAARLTFFQNARTRLALPGTAAFYQALHRGVDGDRRNPFFYISSSAWNLYDLLTDFLELNSIPAGPVLLRDLGIDPTKFIKTGHEHKLDKIRQILNTFPDLPFLLVGDEGQKDPWLYEQIAREFPGRIRAIYIRDIRHHHRGREIARLASELAPLGVELLLIPDTTAAAVHAAEQGWIERQELAVIREDRDADITEQEAADGVLREN